MKVKYIKGSVYRIKFYDHCIGQDEAVICECIGWLEKENDLSIVLNSWRVLTKDEETKNNNRELTTILKSCIISKRKLR